MRIVFIDIHEINFLVRPYRQIKDGNQIATYKHKFVLDYAIKNGIELCSYLSMNKLNEEGSKALKWIVSRKILKKFNYVLRNSYAEPINIKPIINKNEIKDSDILIGYLYNNQLEIMRELKGIKVLMGNHFVAINQPINLDDYGIKAFVNEIDLSDNEFVNRYIYGKGIKHITVPYIYAERFNNQNKVRKNKAMAIGTLSTCSGNSGYRLYREFTGTEWIQPLRKMILDNKDDLIEEVDSYISYIFEDKIVINKEDNILVKYYKKIKNYTTGWTQKKYMSFNMVDKFNEYKMFLCPEEEIGMPGIGFVEGMACGTAYIGLDAPYYRKLGLRPGEDFITYDGTLENLKEVIHYYQKHGDELEKIALSGTNFVRTHFNVKAVSEALFNCFESMVSDV